MALGSERFSEASSGETSVKDIEPIEVSWLTIDLASVNNGHDQNLPSSSNAHKSDKPNGVALIDAAPALDRDQNPESVARRFKPSNPSESIPASIFERLTSNAASQRAAALADLTEIDTDEAFGMIAKSLDDPAVEVRNAAARALYDFRPDRASFTRALREASPERRRKIGAAIAGSGLATDAINKLAGEGHERTHDAYSLLFLMAKAGEVQPLLQAISKHPNVDIRLTTVKLLALSNQPQILPALRTLAARESLPPQVHAAVMEAIYSISTRVREHASSLT